MDYFTVLALLFWLPAGVVIVKNLLWNLQYWQAQDYKFERLFRSILWDHDITNRNVLSTGLKFIFFSLTSLALVTPRLALIGIVGVFILWLFEGIYILETIFVRTFPRTNLLNPRNYVIFLIFTAILSATFAYLTVPFALIDRTAADVSPYFVASSNTLLIVPDVYLYLAISALAAIYLDLASSVTTLILVYLTSPFAWLYNQVIGILARTKLKLRRDKIKIVLIIGSEDTPLTKETLYELTKEKFKLHMVKQSLPNLNAIEQALLTMPKDTDLMLVNFQPQEAGQSAKIVTLLNPDLTIITSVSVNSLKEKMNKAAVLHEFAELFALVSPEKHIIVNADNPYAVELAKEARARIHYYGLKLFIPEILSGNTKFKMTRAHEIKRKGDGFTFKIASGRSTFQTTLIYPQKSLIAPLLASVAAAEELKVTPRGIKKALGDFTLQRHVYTFLDGENGTHLLHHSHDELTYKSMLRAINYALNFKEKHKLILATNGFKELGAKKVPVYTTLLAKIGERVDVLITNEAILAKLARKKGMNVVEPDELKDFIYLIRRFSDTGDIILLEGALNSLLTPSLSSKS